MFLFLHDFLRRYITLEVILFYELTLMAVFKTKLKTRHFDNRIGFLLPKGGGEETPMDDRS